MKAVKTMTMLSILLMTTGLLSQNTLENPIREGWLFEFGIGLGTITLEDSNGVQTFDKAQGGLRFPDLKAGYMVKDNMAVTLTVPGMIYSYQDNDRHFGAIMPGVQYWFSNKWWLQGGIGLAIDSPALYDINDQNDSWNFGKAVSLGVAYEFYQKEHFVMNVQSNLLMGRVRLENNATRDAVSFGLSVGFSWF